MIFNVIDSLGKIVYMIFVHLMVVLLLVSFSMSILVDPGRVPSGWNC